MEAWDVLVLGGTLEGMRSAIAAHDAGANVAIISASGLGDSNISNFNSGIAAPINEDTAQGHRDDTIRSGKWMCDQDIVAIRISSALNHVSQLETWGLNFRRDVEGLPFTEHSFGHKSARITTTGDTTARQLQNILEEQCMKRGISRRGDYFVLSFVATSNQINGVIALDMSEGKIVPIQCKTLIIADGGFESAWNINGSFGRGMQLAMEQGIGLKNMEFQSWSPLFVSDNKTSLPLTLIGNSGDIVTSSGEKYEVDFSSTSNDICIKMLESGNKFGINAKEMNGDMEIWFSSTESMLSNRFGLSLSKDIIPINMSLESTIGGIPVDESCRVIINEWNRWFTGLYAVGDAACSGVHGASVASGNRILDSISGGLLAGEHAAKCANEMEFSGSNKINEKFEEFSKFVKEQLSDEDKQKTVRSRAIHTQLSEIMSKSMGLSRDGSSLSASIKTLDKLQKSISDVRLDDTSMIMNQDFVNKFQLEGLLKLSITAIKAAISREESRGGHCRIDFPEMDNNKFLKHSISSDEGDVKWLPIRKSQSGNWILSPEL